MSQAMVTVGYSNNAAQATYQMVTNFAVQGNSWLGTNDIQPPLVSNSNWIQYQTSVYLTANTTTAVPTGAAGVLLMGSGGNTTVVLAFNANDTGSYINNAAPTQIFFDPNNLPGNITLRPSGGNITMQFVWL